MPHKILYLDDSENNLTAFRALLRRDYDVFITTDCTEALNWAKTNKPTIICSDYRMPEMSGVEFLTATKTISPDSIRFLLTGHADKSAAIASINESEVFRYVDKPFDAEELLNDVQKAIELHETRSELVQKKFELELAFWEMGQLVYSAAHELTGPISTIQGLVGVMQEEPKQAGEYVHHVSDLIDQLGNYVKNLVVFHDNKLTEVAPEAINWEVFINNLWSDMPKPEGVEVCFKLEQKMDDVFVQDPSRLSIMLRNVLNNAVRFRDYKKDELVISCSINPSNFGVQIEIEDNGIGIPEELFDRIFEMHFRGEGGRHGSGFGLYIAQQAAKKIGGDITVESELGKGTKFTIQARSTS